MGREKPPRRDRSRRWRPGGHGDDASRQLLGSASPAFAGFAL